MYVRRCASVTRDVGLFALVARFICIAAREVDRGGDSTLCRRRSVFSMMPIAWVYREDTGFPIDLITYRRLLT